MNGQTMYTVAIMLPGITGSLLVSQGDSFDDTANPVWQTQVYAALNNNATDQQALALMEGNLFAGTPSVTPGFQSYAQFASYFEGLGFQTVNAATPQTPLPLPVPAQNSWGLPQSLTQDLLVSFAYDWRKDNLSGSATYLQNLLATIDHLYGQNDYQVFLIGHSMGGLVARAYLETLGNPAGKPADGWYGKIKGLITLGTPHLGAPLAVDAMSGSLDKLLGLIKLIHPDINIPTNFGHLAQDLVNSQYCQSAYELLPPPSGVSPATTQTQFIKAVGSSYNIFDLSPDGSGKNIYQWLAGKGMSPANWQNANKFLTGLNYTGAVKAPQSALPAYYCVYGSGCNVKGVAVTCTSLAWNGSSLIDLTGDGDMVVPVWSAQFSGRAVAGSCPAPGVDHLQLPGDTKYVLPQVARWMGLSSSQSESHESDKDELVLV
jgi:hypothetical protein